ncbi:MAG: cytochrome P450 [Acidimicrobiia bacterium]|jgi:cytochrome P450
MSDALTLDPARIRELFDLRSSVYTKQGGAFEEDPYPEFHRLRETGPVHAGTVGRLVGFQGEEFFHGLPEPERVHFSVFDFETCDAIIRNPEVFRMAPPDPAEGERALHESSILYMDGDRHRRYRALVQPSFVPARAQWWIRNWIETTVHALIDAIEANGRADLNVEFCAAIPLLTICGSFGVSIDDALDIRAAVTSGGQGESVQRFMQIVHPILEARRAQPGDDLISVLARAELTEGGETHVLSDADILSFSFLLMAAGSGTTWKQMGTTLATMLARPELVDAVRVDRTLLPAVIEEGVRWMPTDPVFSRYLWEDVTIQGVDMPAGAVTHQCYGAANRDPARWERPDEFDPGRTQRTHLAFGNGPHICVGMHVARAEMTTAISALLDRLPGLRLDPDAEPPRIIGMYERGPTSVPAVWG